MDFTFVMPTPTTNTRLFGFWLEAAILPEQLSEVKRTIKVESVTWYFPGCNAIRSSRKWGGGGHNFF